MSANLPNLCEPGTNWMQPFSVVTSSTAIQAARDPTGSMGQKGAS